MKSVMTDSGMTEGVAVALPEGGHNLQRGLSALSSLTLMFFILVVLNPLFRSLPPPGEVLFSLRWPSRLLFPLTWFTQRI